MPTQDRTTLRDLREQKGISFEEMLAHAQQAGHNINERSLRHLERQPTRKTGSKAGINRRRYEEFIAEIDKARRPQPAPPPPLPEPESTAASETVEARRARELLQFAGITVPDFTEAWATTNTDDLVGITSIAAHKLRWCAEHLGLDPHRPEPPKAESQRPVDRPVEASKLADDKYSGSHDHRWKGYVQGRLMPRHERTKAQQKAVQRFRDAMSHNEGVNYSDEELATRYQRIYNAYPGTEAAEMVGAPRATELYSLNAVFGVPTTTKMGPRRRRVTQRTQPSSYTYQAIMEREPAKPANPAKDAAEERARQRAEAQEEHYQAQRDEDYRKIAREVYPMIRDTLLADLRGHLFGNMVAERLGPKLGPHLSDDLYNEVAEVVMERMTKRLVNGGS